MCCHLLEINLTEIGLRIRDQRTRLGYTREYLAEAVGVTPKFCSDIELGKKGMSVQTLFDISYTLRISTDYILGIKAIDIDVTPVVDMLRTCNPDKLEYAKDIIKTFVLAVN